MKRRLTNRGIIKKFLSLSVLYLVKCLGTKFKLLHSSKYLLRALFTRSCCDEPIVLKDERYIDQTHHE